MLDIQSRLQLLPADLKNALAKYPSLDVLQQLDIREKVLKIIVKPQFTERMLALGLAAAISSRFKLLSDEKQAEVAGSLLGGQLGFYSVEIIKDLTDDRYIADPLEESLIAALGGMIGSQSLINPNRQGLVKGYGKYFQTYNLYVLLVHILPVVLRSVLTKQFDTFFITKA